MDFRVATADVFDIKWFLNERNKEEEKKNNN